MEKREQHYWRVRHPELGEVCVEAADRVNAIAKAARSWGVIWMDIARSCDVERLEQPPKKVRREKHEK